MKIIYIFGINIKKNNNKCYSEALSFSCPEKYEHESSCLTLGTAVRQNNLTFPLTCPGRVFFLISVIICIFDLFLLPFNPHNLLQSIVF